MNSDASQSLEMSGFEVPQCLHFREWIGLESCEMCTSTITKNRFVLNIPVVLKLMKFLMLLE